VNDPQDVSYEAAWVSLARMLWLALLVLAILLCSEVHTGTFRYLRL
jgi:hypothetical protein